MPCKPCNCTSRGDRHVHCAVCHSTAHYSQLSVCCCWRDPPAHGPDQQQSCDSALSLTASYALEEQELAGPLGVRAAEPAPLARASHGVQQLMVAVPGHLLFPRICSCRPCQMNSAWQVLQASQQWHISDACHTSIGHTIITGTHVDHSSRCQPCRNW